MDEKIYLTIDEVPTPTEPLGAGMQRVAEALDKLDMSWLDD